MNKVYEIKGRWIGITKSGRRMEFVSDTEAHEYLDHENEEEKEDSDE